jgi:hypothetical protein
MQRPGTGATEINYGNSRDICMKKGPDARWDELRTIDKKETAVNRERATSIGNRGTVQQERTAEVLCRTRRVAC